MFVRKNYMQDSILDIHRNISQSLTNGWELEDFYYAPETPTKAPTIIATISNPSKNKEWKLSYSFANYPTYESFLDSLKADIAITNIACNYPQLSLEGCALSKNFLDVKTNRGRTVSLPILRDCLDIESGKFNVDVYSQKLNEHNIALPQYRDSNDIPQIIESPFQMTNTLQP